MRVFNYHSTPKLQMLSWLATLMVRDKEIVVVVSSNSPSGITIFACTSSDQFNDSEHLGAKQQVGDQFFITTNTRDPPKKQAENLDALMFKGSLVKIVTSPPTTIDIRNPLDYVLKNWYVQLYFL